MIRFILYFFLFIFSFTVFAQDIDSTTVFDNTMTVSFDNAENISIETNNVVKKTDYAPLTKSPTTAMFASLIFPGLGQIYVENYWRAVAFTGGAVFLWYSVISEHKIYKDEQKKLYSFEDKNSDEYRATKIHIENVINNRDRNALYLIGVYTLAIIDAYAGAHLYDFSVEQNVNFSFAPNLLPTGNIYWKFGLNYRF